MARQALRRQVASYYVGKGDSLSSADDFKTRVNHLADDIQLMA